MGVKRKPLLSEKSCNRSEIWASRGLPNYMLFCLMRALKKRWTAQRRQEQGAEWDPVIHVNCKLEAGVCDSKQILRLTWAVNSNKGTPQSHTGGEPGSLVICQLFWNIPAWGQLTGMVGLPEGHWEQQTPGLQCLQGCLNRRGMSTWAFFFFEWTFVPFICLAFFIWKLPLDPLLCVIWWGY